MSDTETLNPAAAMPTSDEPKPAEQPPPHPEDPNLPEKRKRETELQSDNNPSSQHHPLWKTSLCSFYRSSKGVCSHGDNCRFAHDESELRPKPDNTWDPTSDRAKKLQKVQDEEKAVKESDVMMTEAVEAEGGELVAGLSKCFVDLPMKWTNDELRSFLTEQKISYKSAKKKKGMTVGFVTFESVPEAKIAVEVLDGKPIGNNRTLKIADAIPRTFEKHNKSESPQPQDNDEAEGVPNDSVSNVRSVRDAVTPLAHLSYVEQLEHKKSSLTRVLKKLTRNARKACPHGISLPEWIQKSREIGGLPCKLEGIIESPLIDGYRNKCEFSVGYSLNGKATVGFLLGNFREGVTAVEEPVDCPNVSSIARKYAAVFQEFLQHSSLPIWNRLNNTGFWRQLTVREGRKPCVTAMPDNLEPNISDVLLIVQVCTAGLGEEQFKGELEKLVQDFAEECIAESPLPLTAVVIQDHTGISNAAPSDAPLRYVFTRKEGHSGLLLADDVVEPRIHDYISNLRFSISPSAFFQVNTLAAEKLYSLAGDWADLGPDTLLFDVCCGTGTIGLTLAHRVGMVVGIEMNASAVVDAQRNAEINRISNCRFVCGKAEDVIGSLMKEYLSLPQKLDEVCTTQNNEHEVNTKEEEIKSADSELGSDNNSSAAVHKNGCGEVKHSEDETRAQEHCTSEHKSTTGQQFKNVVAIVDPPRVGLHPTVIKVLRTQSRLRRLVYISCNPESLVANAIELCTPSVDEVEKGNNKNNKRWRNMSSAGLARHRAKSMPSSEPFRPVKSMAVDLFPHTPHCELVMLLER